jgi:uncharacterized repeat protein (TIGR02543 family)
MNRHLLNFAGVTLLALFWAATTSAYAQTTYAITIANGTGSGSYASGTVVPITANAAPSGYQFAGWIQPFYSVGTIANPAATSTNFTTGAGTAEVTASYTPVGGTTYPLTVTGGTGSGSYVPGTIVTVTANNPASGYQFARWLGPSSAFILSNADASTTTITMPSVATTITSSYTPIPTTYAVTVTNGVINNDTGSGHYAAGTVLSVTANAPANGSHFTGWTGTTGALANASFSTTTVTVPASAVTITANSATTTASYALTVSTGTGGGTYAPGTAITVTANAPAAGYQFAGWTGSTASLSNASAPSTTFNMPSGTAAITATYTQISSGGKLVLAVGLEKIVSGYSGPLIRVQRPSDNTQMDIYAATGSNQLDTAAVSSFLGQTQGWITTLYAQDGSGHNVGTAMPTSTATMPTISAIDPTSISVNGTTNLTARNIEQPYQYGQGNFRYFVLPQSLTVNKSQVSVFLACRPDYSGGPFMSLYEIGQNPNPVPATSPTINLVDLMTTNGGLQGMSQIVYQNNNGYNDNGVLTTTFGTNSVVPRCQPTVLGLVSSPSSSPLIYLDGVSHLGNTSNTPAVSANCSGGYLLAGNGSGNIYEQALYGQYNFLAFAVYSGTVSPSTAASISNTMLPRTVPTVNIVASGDSITQGTGTVYSYNMLRQVEPLLNAPADITNLAVYGTTSYTALNDMAYTEPNATAPTGKLLYSSNYATNIYYVDIGTNDIHNGGVGSGATAWNVVKQALTAAKAIGYKTAAATLLHEYSESSTAATEINSFNSLLRAAAGQPYLDAIIDYQADPRLGNTGIYYGAYSGDGTHPSDLGNEVMASIAAPIFNSFIGQAPQAPTITNTLPATTSIEAGDTFSFTYQTSANTYPAAVFSVASGSLPPGLTLSSTGVLSGTPSQVGTFTGTISATNSAGSATQSFTIMITAATDTPTMPVWGLAILAMLLMVVATKVPGNNAFRRG